MPDFSQSLGNITASFVCLASNRRLLLRNYFAKMIYLASLAKNSLVGVCRRIKNHNQQDFNAYNKIRGYFVIAIM